MRFTVLRALGIVLAFSLFIYGAYAWQRRVHRGDADRYNQLLRSLLTLDAQLVDETMKARVGIVGHYDAIAQTEAALKRTRQRLHSIPQFLPNKGKTEVGRALAACDAAHRNTQEIIERFKTEYAVLRNSLRFLPVAADHLESYVPSTEAGTEFETLVNSLVRDVLLLQAWSDERIASRVSQSLDALTSRQAEWTEISVGPDLGLILQHARVVQQRAPIVADLVRSVADSPLSDRSHEVAAIYGKHYQTALASSNRDLGVLFVLALLGLTTSAAYVILRLRESRSELEASRKALERTVETLQIEKEKQKELSELKSRFVSMTSHEFRTPLSVIVSSSEMLSAYSQTMSPAKKEGHLDGIRTAALGMTKMLDSILLIGRSDAGMLQCHPAPVDLKELCDSLVEATEQSTRASGRITMSGPPCETVLADSELLRHALENLLSNAIKYSPNGHPVHFSVARDFEDLVFEVSDHGIGISEQDLDQLFETFYRGSNVGKVSGTGLGLSIVKRAVDLHGGRLSVQSAIGEGSTFTVRVPCPRSST